MSWIAALRNRVFGLVKNPRTRLGMEANLQGMRSELHSEPTFLTRETLRSAFSCLPHLLEHQANRIPDAPAILALGHGPLTTVPSIGICIPDAGCVCGRAAFAGEWFKTGDVGFLDEDGYLFLVGRSREISNRGGEKIALPRLTPLEQRLHSPVVTRP